MDGQDPVPRPPTPTAAAPPRPTVPPPPGPATPPGGSKLPMGILIGFLVAGAIVGGVFLVQSLSKKDDPPPPVVQPQPSASAPAASPSPTVDVTVHHSPEEAMGASLAAQGFTYLGECSELTPEDADPEAVCSTLYAQDPGGSTYLVGPPFSEGQAWYLIVSDGTGYTVSASAPVDESGAPPWS